MIAPSRTGKASPIAGRCPICGGTVVPHHGEVVQCGSCTTLLDRDELVPEREAGR